jgi:hypothetical protein
MVNTGLSCRNFEAFSVFQKFWSRQARTGSAVFPGERSRGMKYANARRRGGVASASAHSSTVTPHAGSAGSATSFATWRCASPLPW